MLEASIAFQEILCSHDQLVAIRSTPTFTGYFLFFEAPRT
jgi:hypothetical protein